MGLKQLLGVLRAGAGLSPCDAGSLSLCAREPLELVDAGPRAAVR